MKIVDHDIVLLGGLSFDKRHQPDSLQTLKNLENNMGHFSLV